VKEKTLGKTSGDIKVSVTGALQQSRQTGIEGLLGGLMVELAKLPHNPNLPRNVPPPLSQPTKSEIILGQKNTISGAFNHTVQTKPLQDAYLKTLPQRLGVESWIVHLQRLLYTLKQNELRLSLTYAA